MSSDAGIFLSKFDDKKVILFWKMTAFQFHGK